MSKNEISISAWTPPTNGWVRAYNGKEITEKIFYEDFRTEKRYQEYRDCGFDEMLFAGETKYVGEPFETSELKMMLDLCAKCDIKAVVFDERILSLTVKAQKNIIGEFFDSESAFDDFLRDCIKDYTNHPAFCGVSVIDEPFIAKKEILHEIARAMKRVCPQAVVHTCFNPLFCVAGGNMEEVVLGKGKDSFDAYGNYIDAMSIPELGYFCYDDYPFKFWEGLPLEPKFIKTMQFVSRRCQKNNLPYHMAIQSYAGNTVDKKGNDRMMDEADLNWQANLALGFGAKKIYYYTYWRFQTRGGINRPDIAIMNDDGTKILYEEAQRNNALIRRIFAEIGEYSYDKSQLLGNAEGNATLEEFVSEDVGLIQDYAVGSPVLVNSMTNGDKKAYMFFNCENPHIKKVNRVRVTLKDVKSEYNLLVRGRRMTVKAENGEIILALEPGQAVWILDM